MKESRAQPLHQCNNLNQRVLSRFGPSLPIRDNVHTDPMYDEQAHI